MSHNIIDEPRIQEKIPLEINHGLVPLKKVAAGSEICNIRPLLNIINHEVLTSTCDFCLSTSTPNYITSYINHFDLCYDCKVLSYCGTTCKINAWTKYHRFECPIFKRLVDASGADSIVYLKETRLLIRLFLLRYNNVIQDKLWTDFELLYKVENYPNLNEIKAFSKLLNVLKIIPSGLNERDLEQLISGVFTNVIDIHLPVLRVDEYKTLGNATIAQVGWCLEPFVNTINHSCRPNSALVFDGRQLYLRARTDIKPGEEITISYIDYYSPIDRLGLKCNCPFRHFQMNQQTLRWRSLPIYKRYQAIITRLEKDIKGIEALEACLHQYYSLEPLALDPVHRLSTLFDLIALISRYAPVKFDIIMNIVIHLKAQAIAYSEHCFGKDSYIVTRQRIKFRDFMNGYKYIPLNKNDKTQTVFVENMEKLWKSVENLDKTILPNLPSRDRFLGRCKAFCKLKDMLQRYQEVTDIVLSYLKATEIAIVLRVFELTNYHATNLEKVRKWLNPLRDLDQYEDRIKDLVANGYHVVLVGKDLQLLIDRINDPIRFWKRDRELFIWVAIVEPDRSLHTLNNAQLMFLPLGNEWEGPAPFSHPEAWRKLPMTSTNITPITYMTDQSFGPGNVVAILSGRMPWGSDTFSKLFECEYVANMPNNLSTTAIIVKEELYVTVVRSRINNTYLYPSSHLLHNLFSDMIVQLVHDLGYRGELRHMQTSFRIPMSPRGIGTHTPDPRTFDDIDDIDDDDDIGDSV